MAIHFSAACGSRIRKSGLAHTAGTVSRKVSSALPSALRSVAGVSAVACMAVPALHTSVPTYTVDGTRRAAGVAAIQHESFYLEEAFARQQVHTSAAATSGPRAGTAVNLIGRHTNRVIDPGSSDDSNDSIPLNNWIALGICSGGERQRECKAFLRARRTTAGVVSGDSTDSSASRAGGISIARRAPARA